MGSRTFATAQELLWYNCSPVCGLSAWQLFGGANANLLQEDLCHMPRLQGLLQPEPLSLRQAVADPCLCRRYSHTQRQVHSLLWRSLILSLGPWCAQGFVCTLQASLAGTRFDSKHNCAPPTVLLVLPLCTWMWGIKNKTGS